MNQFYLEPTSKPGKVHVVLKDLVDGKKVCVDVEKWSKDDGAKVHLYQCGKQENQTFSMKPLDGNHVALVAEHSGKCLDVSGGSKNDGTELIQYSCHYEVNQSFELASPESHRTHFNWATEDEVEHNKKSNVHCYEYEAQGNLIGRADGSIESCKKAHPLRPAWGSDGKCYPITPSKARFSEEPIAISNCAAVTSFVFGAEPAKDGVKCLQGYVQRKASPFDSVCVSPAARAQAAADNRMSLARVASDGDSCKEGFVWRNAFQDDHVCVSKETEAQVAKDNAAVSHAEEAVKKTENAPKGSTGLGGDPSIECQPTCTHNDAYDTRESDQLQFDEVRSAYHEIKNHMVLPLDGSGTPDPRAYSAQDWKNKSGMQNTEYADVFKRIEGGLERFKAASDATERDHGHGDMESCHKNAAKLTQEYGQLEALLNEAPASTRHVFFAYFETLDDFKTTFNEQKPKTLGSAYFCTDLGRWNEGKAYRAVDTMVEGIRAHMYALLTDSYRALATRLETAARGPDICVSCQ